jgi:hypothetical protein
MSFLEIADKDPKGRLTMGHTCLVQTSFEPAPPDLLPGFCDGDLQFSEHAPVVAVPPCRLLPFLCKWDQCHDGSFWDPPPC